MPFPLCLPAFGISDHKRGERHPSRAPRVLREGSAAAAGEALLRMPRRHGDEGRALARPGPWLADRRRQRSGHRSGQAGRVAPDPVDPLHGRRLPDASQEEGQAARRGDRHPHEVGRDGRARSPHRHRSARRHDAGRGQDLVGLPAAAGTSTRRLRRGRRPHRPTDSARD